MSLDLEERLKIFLASAPQTAHEILTCEISHSQMTKTYYLWREPYAGQITLEDETVVNVEPLNLEISLAGTEGHLDQRYEISLCTVDVEDEFREQLDRIDLDTDEKIVAVVRSYLSDDLTIPQAVARLQVENIVYAKGAAKLSAVSPRLNVTRTGVLYAYRDLPMLRGFI